MPYKYVEDLRNSGVPDKQAEAQIRILHEVIESNLAAKKDIKELEQKMNMCFKELEQKLIIKLGSLLIIALTALLTLSNLNLI